MKWNASEQRKLEEYDLMGCIDKGLEQFGSYAKQTIYWRMMILHGSQHDGVIANPSVLANVIKEIMGESSFGIEKSIIREIRKVFDLPVRNTDTLTNAINAAKEMIVPVSTEKAIPLTVACKVNGGR